MGPVFNGRPSYSIGQIVPVRGEAKVNVPQLNFALGEKYPVKS